MGVKDRFERIPAFDGSHTLEPDYAFTRYTATSAKESLDAALSPSSTLCRAKERHPGAS